MPTKNPDIARRICLVFVSSLDLNLYPDDPSFPADLSSVAGMDSLAVLEFVAGLEDEFKLQIDPDMFSIEFFSDLHALSGYIAERIQQGQR
jgi:acyl carrier protein